MYDCQTPQPKVRNELGHSHRSESGEDEAAVVRLPKENAEHLQLLIDNCDNVIAEKILNLIEGKGRSRAIIDQISDTNALEIKQLLSSDEVIAKEIPAK